MSSSSTAPRSSSSKSASVGAIVLAAVIDVVLVLVFVLVGRGSHGENVVTGALVTFWPFVTGLVIGWLVCLAWRRPFALWPTAIVVWFSTLLIGMILRVVSAQGIAVSFVIVAAIVLAVFLIGWRAIALLIFSARARRASARGDAA